MEVLILGYNQGMGKVGKLAAGADRAWDFHCSVLRIPANATMAEVKRNFRLLAFKTHPDFCRRGKSSAEQFRLLHESYVFLLQNHPNRKRPSPAPSGPAHLFLLPFHFVPNSTLLLGQAHYLAPLLVGTIIICWSSGSVVILSLSAIAWSAISAWFFFRGSPEINGRELGDEVEEVVQDCYRRLGLSPPVALLVQSRVPRLRLCAIHKGYGLYPDVLLLNEAVVSRLDENELSALAMAEVARAYPDPKDMLRIAMVTFASPFFFVLFFFLSIFAAVMLLPAGFPAGGLAYLFGAIFLIYIGGILGILRTWNEICHDARAIQAGASKKHLLAAYGKLYRWTGSFGAVSPIPSVLGVGLFVRRFGLRFLA